MRRKPRWAAVGPVGDLAAELRKQLDRCRVDRAERKRMVATLRLCGADDVDKAILQSRLVEALTKFCPPHAVFELSEGGDWGFWAVVNDELPREYLGRSPRELWGLDCYMVGYHGHISCGRLDFRGRFQPYWTVE